MTTTSHMTRAQLREAMTELYGNERGAQKRLASAMKKTEATVSRWTSGQTPIGRTEAQFIRFMVAAKQRELLLADSRVAKVVRQVQKQRRAEDIESLM